MANYQEQIEKNRKAKSDVAERAFDRMCGNIAEVLLPYIEDKTLTNDQASALMVKIVRAVLSMGNPSPNGDSSRG